MPGLSRGSGRPRNEERPEGVDQVYPAFTNFPLQLILRGQVDRVFIFQQSLFLGKCLIFLIENILSHFQEKQPGQFRSAGHHRTVTQHGDRYIKFRHHLIGQRELKEEGRQKEEHYADDHAIELWCQGELVALPTLFTEQGEDQEEKRGDLGWIDACDKE